METFSISATNIYNIPNLYNEQAKKPVYTHKTAALPKEQNAEDQTNKSADADSSLHRHYNFKKYAISFSVEKDLHVIVTVVKDPNTKKVLQQIPSEDAIRRMRFIKTYLASLADEGRIDNTIEAH